MKVNSKTTAPAARNSPWLGIVKFLFLVILIAIIFLLGQDMVRHRFFQGGWVSQHDVLKP
jgi:ABC-type microcin C transport system permease subunit YejE